MYLFPSSLPACHLFSYTIPAILTLLHSIPFSTKKNPSKVSIAGSKRSLRTKSFAVILGDNCKNACKQQRKKERKVSCHHGVDTKFCSLIAMWIGIPPSNPLNQPRWLYKAMKCGWFDVLLCASPRGTEDLLSGLFFRPQVFFSLISVNQMTHLPLLMPARHWLRDCRCWTALQHINYSKYLF